MATNKQTHPYNVAKNLLIEINEEVISLIQNIGYLTNKSNEAAVSPVVGKLKDTMKSISTALKASKDQVDKGMWFKLSSQMYTTWGNTSLLETIAPFGAIDKLEAERFTKLVKSKCEKVREALNESRKRRPGDEFKRALHSMDWKGGLAGSGVGLLSGLIPGGGLLTTAYNLWDSANKSSYQRSESTFQSSISDMYKDKLSGGSATSGKSVAEPVGGGGSASGMSSGGGIGADLDNRMGAGGRWRGSDGKLIKGSQIKDSWAQDPLFKFFNTGAYFAGWTKDVLDALKGNKASANGGGLGDILGGIGKKIMGFLPALMSAIIPVILVGLAAFGGFKIGQFLDKKFGITDKIQGTLRNFEEKQDLAKMSKSVSSDAITQKALELQSKNSHLTTRQAVDQAVKILGVGSIHAPNSGTEHTKILKQILDETKKQGEAKKESTSSSTSSSKNTPRVVYKDIGDNVSELINSSVMGQPRK